MLDRNKEFPIPCPKCDKKILQSISRLESEPNFACPDCGTRFNAEELKRKLEEAAKLVDDARRRYKINFKIK